jgi:uncharacterized repeat protein (TIGR02543 family)
MKNFCLIAFAGLLLCTVSCKDDDGEGGAVYTVAFEADGGSPAPASQQVEAGGKVTAPSVNPTKTGYVFLFWHLNGKSTAYNFQSPVNSDFTLYAEWQAQAAAEYWSVTWNLNGGAWPAGDNHASEVVKGGALSEPAAPVRPGYSFDGWYRDAALGNKVSFPYDGATGNFTLYAKWTTEGGNPSANVRNIGSAAEWEAAVTAVNAAGKNKSHTFIITRSFEVKGANATIFTKELSGLDVTIRGEGDPAPVISLAGGSTGSVLYFAPHEEQRIVLENIVLRGHDTNDKPAVYIGPGDGDIVLGKGARITGNTNSNGDGGGVRLGGSLTIKGGEITNNTSGTSGKTNGKGAGVYMTDMAELTMEDGLISGNLAYGQGGGVYIGFGAYFNMKGGQLSSNMARAVLAGARGGGVYNSYGNFYMSGGIVNGYSLSHGDNINISEHLYLDPNERDECNTVVLTAKVVGNFGAALFSNLGDSYYGVFNGEEFTESGSLGSRRERDIKVVDGVLQP